VNAEETIAVMRAVLEESRAELQQLDPEEAAGKLEGIEGVATIIATVERWHGLA